MPIIQDIRGSRLFLASLRSRFAGAGRAWVAGLEGREHTGRRCRGNAGLVGGVESSSCAFSAWCAIIVRRKLGSPDGAGSYIWLDGDVWCRRSPDGAGSYMMAGRRCLV